MATRGPDGSRSCLGTVCGRLKGMIIGTKMMNRFGWAVVTILSLAMFTFSSMSIVLPWWAIDYTDGCDGYYIVVMLRNGLCQTSESQRPETDKCISWTDSEAWDEVELASDSSTSARHIYPVVEKICYAAGSLMFLQLCVCIFQWVFMAKVMWLQRCVLFMTFSFVLLQTWANSIGSATTLTDTATWEFTNNCNDANSYPGLGDYFTIGAVYIGWVVFFVANFPEKCCCVHLTRSDQDLSTDEENSLPVIVNPMSKPITGVAEVASCDQGRSSSCIKYGEASSAELRSSSEAARTPSLTELAARGSTITSRSPP